jgi:hypothetical protein
MAHKRKKKIGKRPHGRRKIRGVKSTDIVATFVGIVGGAVIGRILYTSVTLPQYVMGVSQVGVGGVAAWAGDGIPLVRGLGYGLMAYGATVVAEDTNVIQGICGVLDMGANLPYRKRIAGYYNVPRVAGFPKPGAVGCAEKMMGRIHHGVYR